MTKQTLYYTLHTVLNTPCNAGLSYEEKLDVMQAIANNYGVYFKTNEKFISDNVFEDGLHKALASYGTVANLFMNEMACNAMEKNFELFGELCDQCLNFGGINCAIQASNGKTFGDLNLDNRVASNVERILAPVKLFSSALNREK